MNERPADDEPPWLEPLRRAGAFDEPAAPSAASPRANGVRLLDLTWRRAIDEWMAGNPSRLARLLRQGEPPPRFASVWLAGVLDGTVKRPRGKPRHVLTTGEAIRNAGVVSHYYLLHNEYQAAAGNSTGGTPSERAIADTATRFAMSETAVSRIVFPRHESKSPI